MSQKIHHPAISVVLPFRDAAPTLARAIESILNQTFSQLELLLIDDHSTDASIGIARSFQNQDARVSIHSAPSPGGIVAALNHGISVARAPLIARMDADDFSLPNRLARQVAFLETHDCIQMCACNVEILPDPTNPHHHVAGGFLRYQEWLNTLISPAAIHRERFIEAPLAHPTAVMRRDALLRAGGYRDLGWAEDYDLWLRLLEQGPVIGKVDEILLQWTDGTSRLTRTDGRYSQTNFLRAKAHFLSRIQDVREGGVRLCGAGPTGKKLAKFLQQEGITIDHWYDVHPRRIGGKIKGAPVYSAACLLPAETAVLLAAVGQPDQRPVIRNLAKAAGYTEGANFWLVS